jgi:glycosyltransferase involved in cell wall biosynthesis
MAKLTVIIPVFNEEINIGDCIERIRWADEILIVDSFSTDNTLEIVKKYDKTRIIQREYKYSTSQKNWAIPQAGNDWILLVDADERVSQELAEEIKNIIGTESDTAAYRIKRQNYFLGKRMRYSGCQNDSVIRLFRKDLAKYEDKYVHGRLIVEGKIGMLNNPFSHYTVCNLEEYFEKMARYTTWAALEKLKKGKKVNGLIIAVRTILVFLRNYILRLGFLDGIHGFILCSLSAFSEYVRLCKLWELRIQGSLREGNELQKD